MNEANEYARQHKNYEKRIRPLFLNAIRKQIEPVIVWIERNPGTPPVTALVDSQIFVRPMIRAYGMVGDTAAKREYYNQKKLNGTKSIIDILSDAWNAVINSYAVQYAYRITNELTATTIREIQNALAEGYRNQLNNNQMAAYIRKRVQGEISRHRATMIARTEATTASNLGKEQGAKTYFDQQGVKGYKEWIGRNDGHERHTHIVLNGTVVPIEDEFKIGNDYGLRPGDVNLSAAERVNCRCTLIYMSERAYNRRESSKKFTLGFLHDGSKYMTENISCRTIQEAELQAQKIGCYVIGEFVEETPE